MFTHIYTCIYIYIYIYIYICIRTNTYTYIGSTDDVAEDMREKLDLNPNTIQYRFRTEKSTNGGCTFGCFVLTWMGKSLDSNKR
jgi:hypothetical protein